MSEGRRYKLLATSACLTAAAAFGAPGVGAAASPRAYLAATTALTARPSTERAYTDVLAAEAGARAGRPSVSDAAPPVEAVSAWDVWERTPVTAASLQQDAPPQRLNPSNRTIALVVPLKDGAVYLGDIEIRVAPDDSVEIAVGQAVELMGRTLDPAALEPLRPLSEPGVYAPLSRFEAVGLPISFNPRSLELTVAVPASARGRQAIGLADLDREVYGDFAPPSAFSAYLNLRGAMDYIHEGSMDTGFGDALVVLDGAARFGRFVLESEGAFTTGDGGFQRDGTRLVFDDVARLNRWTVGDLQMQTRGFQGVQDMAGVGVIRSYSLLDPQRNVVPRGGRSFSLDRESTVEAFINGRSVRTVRLGPGTYDVNDFPFVQGSNDVNLVISDDAGIRNTVSFSLFIDRTQLAEGLSEFGIYGGVRTDRSVDDIEYTDDPVFTAFYRRGVTESLTLGGNIQYAETNSFAASMIAGEAVWGSPFGTVGADFAVSDHDVAGSGWAVNLSLERVIPDESGGFSLLASVEARSEVFGPPTSLNPTNPYSLNATVSMNKSFGDSSFAGAQLRYAAGRGTQEDERSVRVSYGRRITDNLNVILDADYSEGGFGDGASFRIALVQRFGETGSARAEYDSLSERARLGYQTSGGRGVGAWSATANLDADSDRYGLNGAASYAANRADLGLAHTTAYLQDAGEISDQRTSMRAATSIAFAGGRFAVGRPVSDGFVIVQPYERARDVRIEVEPSPDGYHASSGVFGPALYGQVSSYSPRTITYDAPGAPANFDVGQGAVRVMPPYRAGYLVTVGSDYATTVIGRLLNNEGGPVVLLAGKATEIGGEGRVVDVFTNRSGTFGASGLKAGRWRIELGGGDLTYDLVVPESADGVARVGDLRPAS